MIVKIRSVFRGYLISITSVIISIIVVISCSKSDNNTTQTPPPVTASLASVTTSVASSIGQTSATSGGTVNGDGGSAITARGICWATTQNPTTDNSKTTETGTTGAFSSTISGITGNTLYYVRAYAINSAGTAYGAQISFTTTNIPATLPVVTTTAVTAITFTTATSGGNVTSDGGGAITARGVCWSTTTNPTTANSKTTDAGTLGSFSSAITGLTSGNLYYVRAYATNSAGTVYGNEISFNAGSNGPVGGNAVCDGTKPTVVVEITSSTGKIWMDRNLGASRAATSSTDYEAYGCLYQWGRGNDGHAGMTWTSSTAGTPVNGTTTTLSTTDTPGNALFILNTSGSQNWISPSNTNLWRGVNGINNPCPSGFRLPTSDELKAEFKAYAIKNAATAFSSIHKFVPAGGRGSDSGLLNSTGKSGWYWTSTTGINQSDQPYFDVSTAIPAGANFRAFATSVRCIKN
jgi:hypothetical protein